LTLGKLKRRARQSAVVELINHVIAQHEKGMTPDQIAQQLPINI